ncbi:hypothetical protein 2 [Beihai blue swimmer crab virus 3]|uniref:RNA-directed RNA polymerase n=1 Tax=Beihai blue swimmer crab virus 3 TaxID=1922370 RepID=A0A1L3KF74_9VIRU|nr:hypothetical protein 2 [Beihai blue swimmer crab virus 3]APG76076.1 hypothetical protein 2 [Beihai blue swimmer crab virus 3]
MMAVTGTIEYVEKYLHYNQIVAGDCSGMFLATLEYERRVLSALVLRNVHTNTASLYLRADYKYGAYWPFFKQVVSTNMCVNTSRAAVYGVDYSAPFRHLASSSKVKQSRKDIILLTTSEQVAYLEELPRAKISADHHIHYSAIDSWNVLKEKDRDLATSLVSLLSRQKGWTMTGISGVLGYAALLGKCCAFRLHSRDFFTPGSSMNEWYGFHKATSTNYKMHANIMNYRLEELYEVEVLVNRLDLGMDWDKEYVNRTTMNLTRLQDAQVYKAASWLFRTARASGKRPNKQNWNKFWSKRWEWSTTGATNYPYPNDFQYPAWYAKNKFMTYLQMRSGLELNELAAMPARITAKPSIKYEWGKTRAIYGCDDISHLVYTFVLGSPEELLPSWIPLGASSKDEYVHNLLNQVSSKGYSLCLDFEDFNSQHSSGNMRAVLEAFFDVYSQDLTDDQLKLRRWVLDSVLNQYVMPGSGNTHAYRTEGTLFSGWRLTTFMNTVMNYCYTQCLVEDSGAKSYGTLHSGDDVFMSVMEPNDYIRMQFSAERWNIRLSLQKCFMTSIKEFLRKDHQHKAGAQYLARGVSTLVHGRTESVQHSDIIELLKANETRLEEIVNREGSPKVVDHFRKIYLARIKRDPIYEGITDEEIRAIYELHPVNKGMNMAAEAKGYGLQLVSRRKHTLEGYDLPGVRDYVHELKKYLKDTKHVKQLSRSIWNATERVIFSTVTRVSGFIEMDLAERRVMKSLYKLYSRYKADIHYGKCRLVGMDVVSRDLSESIRHVDIVIGDKPNYYEWLSILI